MKTKQNVSLKNLNPIFTDPLKKFDILHRQIMGTEAVVTSVDTGKHWGSIKKEDRPDDWENFTVEQVKAFSDSKHYNTPCDAVDFRRREPDTDSNLFYYDDLTESEQRYFRTEIYECFPDHIFDIVFSRLCIHVEIDPKPRKLTDEDLEMRGTDIKPEAFLPGYVKPAKLPKYDTNVKFFDQIDWRNMPKALLNGTFRYFTKFNLFLKATASTPVTLIVGSINKLIKLIKTLIDKLRSSK